MKRCLFSPRLYVDGLRQLRLMGVLFTVANCLVAICIPVMNYLDYLGRSSFDQQLKPNTVTALEMNPLAVLLFCAYAPIMMLYLFSFLNKRESSDFYHAVPATRPCLFFSFFAAVLTWALGILVISSAVSIATYALFPELYLINYASFFYSGFNVFAGACLVSAAVAIAMSVTGTTFINILLALIIIFFPRILLMAFTASMSTALPLVDGIDFIPLLSAVYNVPVGTIFSLFSGNFEAALTQWQSGVYTLVVAILYTAVAVWLFTRRRSESAGQSAPSRKLQALYRFLVGFIVSSITTLGLFNTYFDNNNNLSEEDIGTFVFAYILAIFVMLVFEVFCTKSFRRLFKKAAITVGFLAVANVILFSALFATGRLMCLYTPKAEDITSVRLFNGLEDNYNSYSRRQNYFAKQTAEVDLTDAEIREIVARQLQFSVDCLEISRSRYYEEMQDATVVPVAIKDGLTTRYRKILMYSKDIEAISKRLETVEEYREAYRTLPDKVDSLDVSGAGNMYLYFKDSEELDRFYQTFKREIEALSFEERYSLLNNPYYVETVEGQSYYLNADLSIGGKWYYLLSPIPREHFPETTQLMVDIGNRLHNGKDGLDNLSEFAEDINELSVYINYPDGRFESVFVSPKLIGALEPVNVWLDELYTANATEQIDTHGLYYYIEGRINKYESYKEDYYEEMHYFYAKEPSGELPEWLSEYLKQPTRG